MLHYLTPEEGGVASGRTPLPSVNDVLRDGRVVREKGRVRVQITSAIYFLTIISRFSASEIPTASSQLGRSSLKKTN